MCRIKIAMALDTNDVVVTGAHDDLSGSHISIYVTLSYVRREEAGAEAAIGVQGPLGG